MIINCSQCNVEFNVLPYKVKALKEGKVKGLYCSRQCLTDWQSINFKKEPKYNYKCTNCGKVFGRKQAIKCNNKFCGKKCQGEYRSKTSQTKVKCDNCHKEFNKKNSLLNKRNFCSKKCSCEFESNYWKEKEKGKNCIVCGNYFKIQGNCTERRKTCSKDCLNKLKSIKAKTDDKVIKQLVSNGIKACLNSNSKETRPERITKEILTRLNLEFTPQKKLYNKFVVDFAIGNNVIEVFGDYWHSNPSFYNEKNSNDMQLKQKAKDRSRLAYLTSCGKNVIVFWENDLYNHEEKLEQWLYNFIRNDYTQGAVGKIYDSKEIVCTTL